MSGALRLPDVYRAATELDAVLSSSGLLREAYGIGEHMTCREAEAFAGLLYAVGLDGHAAALLSQHNASDEEGDDPTHLALAAAARSAT